LKIQISDFEGTVSLDRLARALYSMVALPRVSQVKVRNPEGKTVLAIDLDAFVLEDYHLPGKYPVVMKKGETLVLEVI